MKTSMTLFAQLMDFLPWTTFTRLVDRHGGGRYAKSFACTEQFRVMAFAKLTSRESLCDIEVCLSAQTAKLYHMGFREPVARSTLADANRRHFRYRVGEHGIRTGFDDTSICACRSFHGRCFASPSRR